MQIVDLRQLTSRQLDPLLAEEALQWWEELRWDYHSSTALIKKFIDARSLTGSAILENGTPVGYAFYVLEERKGAAINGDENVESGQPLWGWGCITTDSRVDCGSIPALRHEPL